MGILDLLTDFTFYQTTLQGGPTGFYTGNWSILYAVERCQTHYRKTSLQQHIPGYYKKCYTERQMIAAYAGQNLSIFYSNLVKYFNFRSKIQVGHPVLLIQVLLYL